jgi:shikimate kinase
MQTPIILIGPMSAGKSTIATLLADKLGLPRLELDEIRMGYYKEAGYDDAEASKIGRSEGGMIKLLQYWKPFEAYAVERVLGDHDKCVIDFGAGHSVYEDDRLFARVERAMASHANVILLLPSPDLDKSTEILNMRFGELLLREIGKVDEELFKVNEHFVKHPSNHKLAKIVVYTEGKTPEEACEEILEKLM